MLRLSRTSLPAYLQAALFLVAVVGLLPRAIGQEEARWPFEWQADNFCVHSDFDVANQSDLIDQLRSLSSEISASLEIEIKSETVHLILFSDSKNYKAYLNQYFPTLPDRRAMYIKRRGPGMVFAYKNREMDIDLRHETSHALLNASLAYLPLWLDEGLAEYFEVPTDKRFAGSGHLISIKFQLERLLRKTPDLRTLEELSDLSEMTADDYRDAWSWVHFLIHESEQSRGILTRFLQDIQSGIPAGPLSRRIAAGMPDFKDRYLRHFRVIR